MCCEGKPVEMTSTVSPWAEKGGQELMGALTQGMQQGAQAMPQDMFNQWLAASQVDPMQMMGANIMSQMYGGGFGGGNPYQMPQPGMGQGMPPGMAGQGMPMGGGMEQQPMGGMPPMGQPQMGGQQPFMMQGRPPGFDPYASRPAGM